MGKEWIAKLGLFNKSSEEEPKKLQQCFNGILWK
jgi:hypothetical protein